MSDLRPTVAAALLASLIESTPDRVRRRLDAAPQAAAGWKWNLRAESWLVETGGETVTLPHGQVLEIEHVCCTCLLSPKCFHVLACLTSLEVAVAAAPAIAEMDTSETPENDAVEPGVLQRASAGELSQALAHVLRIGASSVALVVTSALLRAVHQCRAEGLHRLAALGLQVAAGIHELRKRSKNCDLAQLADDVAAALECARHIEHDASVEGYWIGTARRAQRPVHPRKLHGVLAEPIVTRSGFAGAAAYFIGEDDRIYSASNVRPTDEASAGQLARDAYRGGIEIGPLVQPACQLARGLYLGSDMTASADGRLGRGKKVRIVEQGSSSWDDGVIQSRFQRPFEEQRNAAFAFAALAADAQPVGWDFLFLTGTVEGAFGADLLLQTSDRLVRLAIANESPALCFRENLRMLAHAPGLAVRVVARLIPTEPHAVVALAVAPAPADATSTTDKASRLEIPHVLANRICLGFDEIQSPWLVHRRDGPHIVGDQAPAPTNITPLDPLRRRWMASLLSGSALQQQRPATSVAAEISQLKRCGFETGADLLNALSHAPTTSDPPNLDLYLAIAVYLRNCDLALARQKATYG